MQCEWLGERVATVDINRAINNVILDREDAGWGPNAVFRFPLEGGTGAIWKKVAKLIPEKNQVSICMQISLWSRLRMFCLLQSKAHLCSGL